ncbi:MAG: CrcB family protein [Gammaproteobacteria bacterium]|nr:CrcB family protein [Gammaproteobacteria bacterium]
MVNGLDATTVLWVLAGSATGGAARYAVSEAVARGLMERFPWGTLVVNVTGALAIGVWFGAAVDSASLHAGLVLGFLGSYTTVSSFALQSLLLGTEGRWRAAMAYVLASVTICLLAVAIGFAAGSVVAGEA